MKPDSTADRPELPGTLLSRRRMRIYVWLAAAVACGIVGGSAAWLDGRRGAPGPVDRGASAPAEAFGLYVKEHLCAECHADQVTSHAHTAHARALRPSIASEVAAALDGRTFRDPVRNVEFRYRFDPRKGLDVTLDGQFDGAPFPLTYAFGSGTRKTSFLTLIPNRLGETTGIEHRVSVYPGADGVRLDLTGGFPERQPEQEIEHFGRVLRGDALDRCIECHSTGGEIAGQEIRGFLPSVSCQNCHGPQREHVIAMRSAGNGKSSAGGAGRMAAIEQIRLCSRCHPRQGMEEEQAMPPNHIRSVRLQATGFLQSKCYEMSDGQLSCATCHDPHQPIARTPEHYISKCLDCHSAPNAASCSVSPRADCIRCHLPLSETDDGLPFHDHSIRVFFESR